MAAGARAKIGSSSSGSVQLRVVHRRSRLEDLGLRDVFEDRCANQSKWDLGILRAASTNNNRTVELLWAMIWFELLCFLALSSLFTS